MRKLLLLVLGMAVGACAPLLRNTPQEDAQLVRALVQANLDAIAAGRLAAQKAHSRAVRQYAQRMVREHTALQSEASELESASGVPLPAGHDVVEVRRLERLSGAEFDRAYIELTAKRRDDLLRLLERAASRAADPVLRAHAARAIPIVQKLGTYPIWRLAPTRLGQMGYVPNFCRGTSPISAGTVLAS